MSSHVTQGRNLSFVLLEVIGRSIVRGTYEEQSFPIELELAKRHSVSRAVIRETLKMLATKGLVTARPKNGTSVQPADRWNLLDPDILRWLVDETFSLKLLRQVTQLRLGIEPEAAALAAIHADAAHLAMIDSGVTRMFAAMDDFDTWLGTHIAFHVAVLNASGNPFYRQLSDVVANASRISMRFTARRAAPSVDIVRHCAVRDAIARKDARGARRAMRKLIATLLQLIDDADLEAARPTARGGG